MGCLVGHHERVSPPWHRQLRAPAKSISLTNNKQRKVASIVEPKRVEQVGDAVCREKSRVAEMRSQEWSASRLCGWWSRAGRKGEAFGDDAEAHARGRILRGSSRQRSNMLMRSKALSRARYRTCMTLTFDFSLTEGYGVLLS